jgi:hypothetical protein
MKITKNKLKKLIKEELELVVERQVEQRHPYDPPPHALDHAVETLAPLRGQATWVEEMKLLRAMNINLAEIKRLLQQILAKP